MGSALYLLSAILVMGNGLPGELPNGSAAVAPVVAPLQTGIAQTSVRLPAPMLPVMTDSKPKVRVLTASDQKPTQHHGATQTQRWTF